MNNDKRKSDNKLKYESILIRKSNIGKLVIYDLNKSDMEDVAKGYKCQVSNEYGTASFNITVKESKFHIA